MPRVAKRPLTVVLLVVSIMAASVTPALAGSAGGTEGCIPGTCLPPGACAVRDLITPPVVVIGTGSGKFNIVVSKPSQQLLADCQDGKLGLEYEIPVDANDSL